MRSATIAVLILAAMLVAMPVFAGPQCAQHEDIAAALSRQFGEVVQFQGLSADGTLMEIWANPVTGTWTATMSTANGTTCLRASGDHFQAVKPGDPA